MNENKSEIQHIPLDVCQEQQEYKKGNTVNKNHFICI